MAQQHVFRFQHERDVEAYQFVQRFLYVEPIKKHMTKDSVPENGTEYIYVVRAVDAEIKSTNQSHSKNEPVKAKTSVKKIPLKVALKKDGQALVKYRKLRIKNFAY